MDSCTERVAPENLEASISAIQTLSNGDSIWLTALADEEGELHQVDNISRAACNQVKVVDVAKAQEEDPHIGRALKFIKANQRPTVAEKYKEPPLVRKLRNEWQKPHLNKNQPANSSSTEISADRLP